MGTTYSVTSPEIAKTYRFVTMDEITEKLGSHTKQQCDPSGNGCYCKQCRCYPVCTSFEFDNPSRLVSPQGDRFQIRPLRTLGLYVLQWQLYDRTKWITGDVETRKLYRLGLSKEIYNLFSLNKK